MRSKVVGSFEEAVAGVENGSSILVAGFGEPGTPHNLVEALYKQGASHLTLIANGAGQTREDGVITMGNLIEAKRVARVILAFTASTHPSRKTPLEYLNEAGEIEAQITPQGTLAERIRAGGAGIPAFFTPAGVGTEVTKGKEHREFGGRTYVMEEAITANYALIRCWKADSFGNLVFRRSQRNFNPIMAMAADCTLVEAEEIVEVGTLDPDLIHTSGIFVQRVVSIPDAGGRLEIPPLSLQKTAKNRP
ncbi:MAG: succinyl-CoA--3-ketoacid-CoA transferase [Dehalococcoidia bacterium]|nr:succinyl-CoA--3-ketoacid-CoA transferase [Dehalococcoidia bacterium]|tara:strand:- start:10340 stop:11086 length:747 start_codon:yes stop_codon:yes gene_type:complete